MLIDQAVFTSVLGDRNAGYQLAGTSRGVSLSERKQLMSWSPAHDSMYDPGPCARSINFHPLEDTRYCISLSCHAGHEYSERGGFRVYTQCLLLDSKTLTRFSNNPFRIVDALNASGKLEVLDDVPERLEPISLVGRASPVHLPGLRQLIEEVEPEALVSLIGAVRSGHPFGILTPVSPSRLFAGMFDLLPVEFRPRVSAATGLRDSLRRPFRVLARDQRCDSGEFRTNREWKKWSELFDAPQPSDEWSEYVAELLDSNKLQDLVSAV